MHSTRRSFLAAGLTLPAIARAASTVAAPPMVSIPAGPFTMGERETAHSVHLDAYSIGRFLVTNAEYKLFTDATGQAQLPRHWKNGATFPEGKANHPVLYVSWRDALGYCAWLSARTGGKFTLPTEAQWEKAARGPKGYLYPWGNDRNPDNLNYNGVCARKFGLTVTAEGHVSGWKEFTQTAPYRELMEHGGATSAVDAYPSGKSHYGSYDMAGNAWEWCQDWYMAAYHKRPDAASNPAGPTREEADDVNRAAERGKCKVIRGGSWYAHLTSARSVFRDETRRPEGGYHSVGFRLAGA